VDVLRTAYSDEHTSVGIVLIDVGTIELRRRALRDAESTLRRAVSILEKGFPAGHWRTAQAQTRLGRSLHELKRSAEAESLLLAALAVLEPQRTSRRRDYIEALATLELVCRSLGREDEADRYRARRLATAS
jgi:tetratricopeptide (TPR) repeat protein